MLFAFFKPSLIYLIGYWLYTPRLRELMGRGRPGPGSGAGGREGDDKREKKREEEEKKVVASIIQQQINGIRYRRNSKRCVVTQGIHEENLKKNRG